MKRPRLIDSPDICARRLEMYTIEWKGPHELGWYQRRVRDAMDRLLLEIRLELQEEQDEERGA